MTVSLTVMKEAAKDRLIKFTLSLPAPYLRALDALSMGQLEKFIIFFPGMFWTRTKYYRGRDPLQHRELLRGLLVQRGRRHRLPPGRLAQDSGVRGRLDQRHRAGRGGPD